MPYRIDLHNAPENVLDRLIELGALDVETSQDGGIAALMPDNVTAEQVASALGIGEISVSPAEGRDAESVWVLSLRSIQVGRVRIAPPHREAEPGAVRLIDAPVFGTGLHPTTALCLEALDEAVQIVQPEAVLDVGTGSGVLALAALMLGVPRALGIDIDDEALRAGLSLSCSSAKENVVPSTEQRGACSGARQQRRVSPPADDYNSRMNTMRRAIRLALVVTSVSAGIRPVSSHQLQSAVSGMLAGQAVLSSSGGPQDKTQDVAGTWALTVETAQGTGSPSVTLTQDGEKLTGTYSSQVFGEQKVTGTVKGNAITFSFTGSIDGTTLTVTYSGTVEKDTMKGKVTLGELGEGTFTGKKQ